MVVFPQLLTFMARKGVHRGLCKGFSPEGDFLPRGHLAIWDVTPAGVGMLQASHAWRPRLNIPQCPGRPLPHSQDHPAPNVNGTGVGEPAFHPLLLGIPGVGGAFMGFKISPSRQKEKPFCLPPDRKQAGGPHWPQEPSCDPQRH